MTLSEIARFTDIDEKEILNYRKEGYIGGNDCFDERDIKNIAYVRTLKKIGMREDKLKSFIRAYKEGRINEAEDILYGLRRKCLKEIHDGQDAVDVLDGMLREIKNNKL